jgi:capsular exopolysaccharide synthesis family protein
MVDTFASGKTPARGNGMGEGPRYATLRDYLRVLREQRILIIVIAALFAGVALWLAERQEPVYQSEASVEFIDTNVDVGFLGATLPAEAAPDVRAATNAQQIGQPATLAKARAELKVSEPLGKLRNALTIRTEARTNLVDIQARWSNAKFAADLANAVARQSRLIAIDQARARYRTARRLLKASLNRLGSSRTDQLTRLQYQAQLVRLDTLGHFVSPAKIVGSAVESAGPVSPRPVRDTLLGLVLGLTIGVLAAFLRDALDRRLRSATEIRDELRMPLLGHIRRDVLARTLVTENGRKRLTEADLEGFRVLRTNLDFLDVDSPVKTVLVTSALPQEGKSTVATSLASAYVLAGKRTLLVECDLRRPTMAKRLGAQTGPGLSDYLIGQATPSEVVQKIPLTPASPDAVNGSAAAAVPTLVAITAGSPTPRPAELLSSKRFGVFLDQVRDAYDVVVLDSTPLLSVGDALALVPRVDGVVLCVRAEQTTREQARAARRALEHFPERPTGVVVTGVKPGHELDYGYYSYAYAHSAGG